MPSTREILEMTSVKVFSSNGEQLGSERGATALFNGFPWAIGRRFKTKKGALIAANRIPEKTRRVTFVRVGKITTRSTGARIQPFWAILTNLKSRVVGQKGFAF